MAQQRVLLPLALLAAPFAPGRGVCGVAALSSQGGKLCGTGCLTQQPSRITLLQHALAKHHPEGNFCLTVSKGLYGGLANSVKFANAVLEFALATNVTFVMPEIWPTGHSIGGSVKDIMHPDPQCDQETKYVQATCDTMTAEEAAVPNRGKCVPGQFSFTPDEFKTMPRGYCQCMHVIELNASYLRVAHSFKTTWPRLSDYYWRGHADIASREQQRPFDVVMHMRLGEGIEGAAFYDVRKAKCSGESGVSSTIPIIDRLIHSPDFAEKFACSIWYLQVLDALAMQLTKACVRLTIVTDGKSHHPEVLAVTSGSEAAGLPQPTVYGVETNLSKAFDVLARADVLISGGSDFSRLAGVLAHNRTARIVKRNSQREDIDYLPNTTMVPADVSRELAVELLRGNAALQSMASMC